MASLDWKVKTPVAGSKELVVDDADNVQMSEGEMPAASQEYVTEHVGSLNPNCAVKV